ncbi:MAG: hypothetical protein ACRDSF_25590, partial [Pseudonocardiaceae bacterium]
PASAPPPRIVPDAAVSEQVVGLPDEALVGYAQRDQFWAVGCDAGQRSLFGLPGAPEQTDAVLRATNT